MIVFLRAIILYLLIIFSVRMMGKRQIGELQPSELAVTILISNLAVLPIEDTNISLLTGAVPILAIVCIEIIISYVNIKFSKVRKLTSGSPIVVIKNGELIQEELKNLRFSVDDLFENLRSKNVFDISEVNYAVVETNGTVSVMKKNEYEVVKAGMLGIKKKDEMPPNILVSDGQIVEDTLDEKGIEKEFVYNTLKNKHIKISDVFIMLIYDGNKVKIIRKDENLKQ